MSRIAGIDYGTVRIGIALADTETFIASPLENYNRRTEPLDREFFARLAKEERLGLFVVGLPVHLDGRESGKSVEARRFGEWLHAATGVPIAYFDERFTTHEAQLALAGLGLSKKKRKARLDKLAAQIMLSGYLERLRAGNLPSASEAPAALDDPQPRIPNPFMPLLFGCGYLGARVARLWQAAGRAVHVVTRSSERAAEFAAAGHLPLIADVTQPDSLRAALAPLPTPDTVLYAVGYDRRAQAGPSIHEVYSGGLANVLAALPEQTRRVIYISTTGVYSQTAGEMVDERSPTEPRREGGQASLAAERVLAASRFASRAIVLRMAGLYGPGRIPLVDAIRRGEPLAVPAAGTLNLVHIDDAARIVLAAEGLELPADSPDRPALPRVYNISDGQPAIRGEYYAELARLLGAPPPTFIVPPSDSPAAARAASDKRISNARLLRDIAFEFEYPSYRAGLAAMLR